MMVLKNRNKTLFLIEPLHASNIDTYHIQNESVLMMYRGPGIANRFLPRLHQPGFWEMPEKPIIVMQKNCKIPDRDIDLMRAFWIVSDRCKTALISVDALAFEFLECNCYNIKGETLEKRWLCDVTRTLDALDEQVTRVKITGTDPRNKGYMISHSDNMIFKDQLIADGSHIFKMAHIVRKVVADDIFRKTIKESGIKNFKFENVGTREDNLRYR